MTATYHIPPSGELDGFVVLDNEPKDPFYMTIATIIRLSGVAFQMFKGEKGEKIYVNLLLDEKKKRFCIKRAEKDFPNVYYIDSKGVLGQSITLKKKLLKLMDIPDYEDGDIVKVFGKKYNDDQMIFDLKNYYNRKMKEK